jgi:predicted transcriptional regulator
VSKYRSSQQIIESILQPAQDCGREGIPITKLMAKSNLSYIRVNEFITKLTGTGLMNKIEFDGKNTFIITEKGRLYLQEYQKFQSIAQTFGLDL